MDENEMLEVTDAGLEARRGLVERMAPLHGGKAAPWLEKAVKNHRQQIHQVRRGAVAIAVFFAWYSVDNETYVVSAIGSLVKFDIHSDLFEAIEAAARMRGAKAVEFQTARRGLVQKSTLRGYVPQGVVMTKLL